MCCPSQSICCAALVFLLLSLQTETQSQNVISDIMKPKEREHKKNIPVIHKPPADPIAQKLQAAIKQYDLTKWSYAQLRDMINTSCGMHHNL